MAIKTKEELNNKVWYRLLKVIFIGFAVIATGTALVITYYDTKPYEIIDESKTLIKCFNGNTYKAGDIISGYYSETFLSPYDENQIKRICTNTIANETYSKINDNTPKNFELVFQNKNVGSWKDTIKYLGYIIAGSMIIFGGLTKIFYYIVLGTSDPY